MGIDALGDEIEEPFGHDDNDLPLLSLTTMIEHNVRQRIGDEELPAQASESDYPSVKLIIQTSCRMEALRSIAVEHKGMVKVNLGGINSSLSAVVVLSSPFLRMVMRWIPNSEFT